MKRNKNHPKLLSGIKFPDMSQICGFQHTTVKSTLINYLIEKQLQMKTLITIFLGIVFFTSFQPVHSQNFYLHPNGVTCMCPDAAIGEIGIVNGITYTKRTRDQITPDNASTTCTSGITSLNNLFAYSSFNGDISSWDVSNVTDMSSIFTFSPFNQSIENWDVSNVANMYRMFHGSQFNQPIGNWDVSNVTNMEGMFLASQFNKPIGDWNVGNVTNMSVMFYSSQFNKPIGNWDVSNVTNMYQMFIISNFNQPIGEWDVSNVTNMAEMFYGSQFTQPIGDWDVSNVTDMSVMFYNSSFNQPIGNWNVGNVTNMHRMFHGSSFNQLIGNWDVSNVTDMSWMFSDSQFNQPIGNWDVSNVTDMSIMFDESQYDHPIAEWDVNNVTNMMGMFYKSQFNQPIGDWDVSNVTNMSGMFYFSQFNQPIGDWDVSNVTDISEMFFSSQFNQPIGNWDVINVTNMEGLFLGSPFNQPISQWDVSSVTNMSRMFLASQFNQPIEDWNVTNVIDMSGMFWFNSEFNQNISTWSFHPYVLFYLNSNGFIGGNTNEAISFSKENYDLLLQSFSDQNLQNKNFLATNLTYCNTSARNDLINNKGWSINEDLTIITSIDAPENISVIATQDSCFISNIDLGLPTSQSCSNYTISNNAPEIYPLGTTEVIWTITDDNGIIVSDIQNVLVTTPDGSTSIPTSITAPANLTLSVDEGSCFASNVVLGLPSASSCLSYSISNDAIIIFPIGVTQIMWTITDSDGITDQDFQTVTVAIDVDEASVCYVSSDDIEITKNRIFINNLDWNNVVHYEVLRESNTNYFQPIGILTQGESSFLDSTSNNASQTYRYRVRTLDICDNFSPFSTIHRTILLQSGISVNNTVNLSWINYEGISFDSYKIYRKINSGDFELIANVSSNTSVYTDTQANVSVNTYEYYVAIEVQPCGTGNKFSSVEIKSNKASIGAGGILDDLQENQVIIHPNPILNILNITIPENVTLSSCAIFNTLGQKVMSSNKTSFSVEHLPPSTYYINITTSAGDVTKPFIKIDSK